jgi:hypothetical protein
VIRGNSVLLKCKTPSFVSDMVRVDSWQDDDGKVYYHNIQNVHGKKAYRSTIQKHLISPS